MKRLPFVISERDRAEVLESLRKDSEFFAKHNIIDYSLLVGVINKDRGSGKKQSTTDSKVSDMVHDNENYLERVYNSVMVGEKYILGVIDILTEYNTKKKMEYCFKKLVYGDGISAVPPDIYADRFYQFMKQRVFPTEFEST